MYPRTIIDSLSAVPNRDQLTHKDLHAHFSTGQSILLSGSGRDKKYGYRNGIQTDLGDIRNDVWCDLVRELIVRSHEEDLFDKLLEWEKEHTYWLKTKAELEHYTLELYAARIFDNPKWVDYPKDEALKVAIDTISSFLLENDMMVYIIIFDRKAYQISSKLFADINAYIDDRYVEEHRDSYAERISRLHSLAAEESCPIPAAPMVAKAASLDDALKQIDESFSEMLLRKIDESGMTDSQCYKKANIDRKLFSKIKNDKYYKPSKPTVLAFALALELPLPEIQDMLMKAGFALSHSSKFDVIVEYFILKQNYNIYEINEALFAFDQSLIGG